jgi:toxin ParE1/3/4
VSLPLIVLPAARLELIAAQDWYEHAAPGLGPVFRAEVDRQLAHVVAHPRQFPAVLDDVRRARLRRFPYGLFFRERTDAIHLLACFHASRDPMIWVART